MTLKIHLGTPTEYGTFNGGIIHDQNGDGIAQLFGVTLNCKLEDIDQNTREMKRAFEIIRAVNSHEAAQRLAKAARAVMIDAVHMQHNDAYVISAKVYNRLTAALAAFADEQQPEGK